MSLCVGICQMDEFGYCVGCGRTQAEIDGGEPPATQAEAAAGGQNQPPAPGELR